MKSIELNEIDGKVVEVRNDGTISDRPVSKKRELLFYGFPEVSGPGGGECKSITIEKGNPAKDEVLLIQASGNSWFGTYIICSDRYEYVKVHPYDLDFAKEYVVNPSIDDRSLEVIIDERERKRRQSVDIKAMSEVKGLKVLEARNFDGFWSKDYGEFEEIPDGWDLLPKGDAAVTKKVRQGPYWVIYRKKGKYSEVVGTAAPLENINHAFTELGGKEGAIKRLQGKQAGQEKRELQLTAKLQAAIRENYPKIPDEDLDEILKRSRQPGAVGAAQWLYILPKSDTEALDRAAFLAVRAHVRHKYTDYDNKLSGVMKDEDYRQCVRNAIKDDIQTKLEEWKA